MAFFVLFSHHASIITPISPPSQHFMDCFGSDWYAMTNRSECSFPPYHHQDNCPPPPPPRTGTISDYFNTAKTGVLNLTPVGVNRGPHPQVLTLHHRVST